jgi:hypothetical protein
MVDVANSLNEAGASGPTNDTNTPQLPEGWEMKVDSHSGKTFHFPTRTLKWQTKFLYTIVSLKQNCPFCEVIVY